MAKPFEITIIDKDSVLYTGNISSLTAVFSGGSAQILADHAPLAALTKAGTVKLSDEQGKTFSLELTRKGFFHFLNNRALLVL